MKSSFYSSVNGCTWFVAIMHIPGGEAMTLPDFFLIGTASLHMHTRSHSRDVVLLLSSSSSQSIPALKVFPLGP